MIYLFHWVEHSSEEGYDGAKTYFTIASIVIYPLSRVIWTQVLSSINSKLPDSLENNYFALFALQFTFFLYYRNILLELDCKSFLENSIFTLKTAWGQVVGISFAALVCQLFLYPLQMSEKAYHVRAHQLPDAMEKAGMKRLASLIRETHSYEHYLTHLSVEYYYDAISAYFSLFSFVAYFASLKHLFVWNLPYYVSIQDLSDDNFAQLIYRYLYLLGFEVKFEEIKLMRSRSSPILEYVP